MTIASDQEVNVDSVIRKVNRLLLSMAAKAKHTVFPKKDYVLYKGSMLPLPNDRLNGPDQEDNEFFLNSSLKEAGRVITNLGCTPQSFLVDIGCGQGRLPIGLSREIASLRYLGIDVSERSIQWCKTHIESQHPTYQFQHINLINARYNPSGFTLEGSFHLPVADSAADIVYMWGVVTNMEPEHLAVYANEIHRMLRKGGKAFLTANVEDNVPQVSINPENYMPWTYHGPLNIVRYEKQYFLDVFQRAGLTLTDYAHHAAGNCQSDMYFVKQ
jgi:SAM-dependent methyltransferase